MLNEFMNGLEEFKKEINQMSDEEFLAPFLELGIEFVPITAKKSHNINRNSLQRNVFYNIHLETNKVYDRQLIA